MAVIGNGLNKGRFIGNTPDVTPKATTDALAVVVATKGNKADIDLKYDKTGGQVSGDLQVTGITKAKYFDGINPSTNTYSDMFLNFNSPNGGTFVYGTSLKIMGTLGLSITSRFASSSADLSKHLDLYGGIHGISVSDANTLNIVSNAGNGVVDVRATLRQRGSDILTAAGGTMTGAFNMVGANQIRGSLDLNDTAPILSFSASGGVRKRWQVDSSGSMIFRDHASGANHFYITPSGGMWTQQMGDVASYIDSRANAVVNSKDAAIASKLPLTGGTLSGQLTIQNTSPTIYLSDTDFGTFAVHSNGGLVGFLWNGGWIVRTDTNGNIWTAAYGDLTAYINGRANAYAQNLVPDLNHCLREFRKVSQGAIETNGSTAVNVPAGAVVTGIRGGATGTMVYKYLQGYSYDRGWFTIIES